nr:hypothetical protein GCM10020063_036180 [Dactylosporangium thailandense]
MAVPQADAATAGPTTTTSAYASSAAATAAKATNERFMASPRQAPSPRGAGGRRVEAGADDWTVGLPRRAGQSFATSCQIDQRRSTVDRELAWQLHGKRFPKGFRRCYGPQLPIADARFTAKEST